MINSILVSETHHQKNMYTLHFLTKFIDVNHHRADSFQCYLSLLHCCFLYYLALNNLKDVLAPE